MLKSCHAPLNSAEMRGVQSFCRLALGQSVGFDAFTQAQHPFNAHDHDPRFGGVKAKADKYIAAAFYHAHIE